MQNNKIAVAEYFLSIQGEGATAGKRAYFLRLAGCNLMCGGKGTEKDGELHNGATWRCDSIEVWLKGKAMEFDELIQKMGGPKFIYNLKTGVHLIITGGEPLLQDSNIVGFIKHLADVYTIWPTIEIETNGTIMPSLALLNSVEHWNVSPKLSNSGETQKRRIKTDVISKISHSGQNPCFKFVVGENVGFELAEIARDYLPYIQRDQVYLMPAADTRDELNRVAEEVVKYCLMSEFNYSHRVHISVWDKKCGV